LQKKLAKDFPNVSCVDIVRLIERLMDMMKKMLVALQSMAWLTWASGLFVMIAVMIRQLELQRTDAVLLALLGGRSSELRKVFLVQFVLLVLLAAVVGVIAAVALSFAIANFLFEGAYSLKAGPILNSVFFSTMGGLLLCLFYAHRLSRSSAAEILKGPGTK
jgi:putative ABC transport system permease protein